MLRTRRSFGAVLAPSGAHVVEYRQTRKGLQVVQFASARVPQADVERAAVELADLLEALGARGGEVSVAVSGFGSCHHILTLPSAPREVLLPVIQREIRRFYPALFSDDRRPPVIDYVDIDPSGRSEAQQRELLVGALPRPLLDAVTDALEQRRVRLAHWTILPRAVQRLYDAYGDADTTAALLLMTPGAPLIGFFHEGELRLFTEPVGAGEAGDVEGIVSHVERGALFLRQQFRGAAVSQLYAAMSPADEPLELAARIRGRLDVPMKRFGPADQPPGALAALGAALDGAGSGGLNLLPAQMRPASSADRWTRGLAAASAAVLLLAAAWWSWGGLSAESQARQRVTELEREIGQRSAAMAPIEPVLRERRAHAQRALVMQLIARRRGEVPAILWPMTHEGRVRIDALAMTRGGEGWQGSVRGTAFGSTSAEATSAADALLRELRQTLGEDAVRLDGLSGADAREAAEDEIAGVATVGFQLSFSVAEEAIPEVVQ